MFAKVLVAIDFSLYTQKILDRVCGIPGVQEVVLLHVADATHPSLTGWTLGPHIENLRLRMAEKKEFLQSALKVPVSGSVQVMTQGTVARVILDTAEKEQVSLILVGARGINPIQEVLLGSVSSSVIRDAKTTVLVIHARPEADRASPSPGTPDRTLFSRVLVPTDFSSSARDASAFVQSIAGIGEIVLLHVIDRVTSQEEIEEHIRSAVTRLEGMKKACADRGIEGKIHVRVGDPTEMILAVAQEDDISLIAMSAYGTDWFRDLLLGSTTFTVARRAKKPVLVIRTGQETRNG